MGGTVAKLWIVEREGKQEPIYDAAHGFIIRAETEEDARIIASENHGDEGPDCWLDVTRSDVRELLADGVPGVVMTDFCNG
jgi:hypothetical protein